jgi:pyruvate,orthophosphate dikinase
MGLCTELERRLGDLCVIEFVVETGRLWVHEAAVGDRSADAAFRVSASLVDEGVIGLDEALRRVDGCQLAALLRPTTIPVGRSQVVVAGRPGSPGTAAGRLALDEATAREWHARGERPVLALAHHVSPDLAAAPEWAAVVTDLPPLASPTVRDLRALSVPCAAGVHGMRIDAAARALTLPGGARLEEGALLTVDGTTGLVLEGHHETRPSAVSIAVHGPPAGGPGGAVLTPEDPTARGVHLLLQHADRVRRLEVHANAETPEEARISRRLGAQGVGLCRTEHLLLGPRRELVERLVTGEDREGALDAIESFTFADFAAILEVMDGLPVVVRLLDPPLREFLPDLVDLSVETALAEERGLPDDRLRQRLLAVRRWSETNPLLGLRGVRILTVLPQIVDVQVRALAGATASLRARGLDPRPLIMIPLVADVAELSAARGRVDRIVAEVAHARRVDLEIPVGVMIELPRAALTAGAMASAADFFSFGTNDLTQTVWGISRDDAEATFLTAYRESGILTSDPFVSLDEQGVGRLVRLAAEEGRAARPGLGLGACGRHVEDPASVGFFARVGVDYVSCTAPQLPVIRLQAGHEAVLETVERAYGRPHTESG